MSPFPNEHSCELPFPEKPIRITSGELKHNGKIFRILYGFLKGGSSKAYAYRYPKESWTVSEARVHCQEHDGKFIAAKED